MKTILTFISLLIFSTQIYSQPIWNIQNTGTSNNLNRIITRNSNNVQMLIIAGDNGTILRSSNFGLLWEMVSSNTNANLYSIEISGNDTGYAVGSGGTIIRTTDGGNSWSSMASNTTITLKEIRIMSGNTKAVAVGENGTFLKLVNNVWTASQIDTTDLNSINFAIFNTNIMYIIGNYGLILRTTNGGVNWSRLNSNTNNNLNYISPTASNTVVGNNGTALQINNTVINNIPTGTINNLYNLINRSFFYLACGADGTVLRDWSPLATNSNHKLNSITQTNDENCFVAGDNGLVLFTYSINSFSNAKQLNVNNINTWFRNNGSFNRNPVTGNSGFEWPKNSAKYARYASGLWLGAKVGNDTLVAIAEYSYEYLPGYVDDNGIPQGNGDPLYRIYSIIRGDITSPDYLNWPVNQGAYFDSAGRPYFLGTQTMFYSYTDGYPSSHGNNAGGTAPLKAVILQTNWSYTNVNMQDIAFTEYRIINRNSQPWTNAYISIWTDDDLGNSIDDAVGVDTALNLGYTYNFDNDDLQYGTAPPAVGFILLRSPIVPSLGDTVRYYSPPVSNNLIVKPNYRELDLTSFNLYTTGDPASGDPMYFIESYFNMQGLKRNGTQWINPFNSQPSYFPYSGDPVTSTGWIETSGGDRRSLVNFGPLNMNPGDTQSVIFAQVIARGSSNLNSVTQLRSLSTYAQTIYDQNFQSVISVNNISTEIPDRYLLNQNYPNPFNPSTVISYQLTVRNFVTLKVYDALGKGVVTLVNEKQNAGKYSVKFNGSNLSSGIYFYKIEINDFVSTKKMLLIK